MTKYNWNERHIITFPEEKLALATKDLHVYYGQKEAIKGIDMQFEKNKITALIGPSGCGKSTFLRSLNRMNDTIDIAKVTGQILYEGIDVNAKNINVYEMRKHIGMVFQRPNPFAKSIYKNITFAQISLYTFRWSTTTFVYCSCHCCKTKYSFDGRTCISPRPSCNNAIRRYDV